MTFTVFGLTGYGYGLAAAMSALAYLGLALALRRKTRADTNALLLYGVLGLLLGLFFSRIFFCAVNIDYFNITIEQPAQMLAFWTGGYSMAGLFAGLVLAALFSAKLKKANPAALLDAAALPLGVLVFGLRLAESFTGVLGVGRQVDAGALAERLPFLFLSETLGTMELDRLAVYRYEAAFALVIFGLMLLFARRRRKAGDLALLFFILYGAGQILFESMRDDGHMVLGFIRVQQVLALLQVLITLGVLSHRYGRLHKTRHAVNAAWALLPVPPLILVMMLAPINHVLDLSGHIGLGIAILAGLGLYLALFLRTRNANPRLIFTALLTLLMVVACVLLEFSMDASHRILRDYALLALCCAVLFFCPFTLYRTLNREEALS